MSEYIKREDVKEQLLSYFREEFRKSDTECTIGIALDAINAAPAADVEHVVRGEWKELPSEWNRETDELLMPRNECSVCHKWIECYKNYNFCPHCGAHMSAERSGSDE